MTVPTPSGVTELDQAVIDAGRELALAHLEDRRDPERVAAARDALKAARSARWPDA